MRVIELYAGPGSGKSTTAAGLFNLMKLRGLNVELVTEYAKDLTWAERPLSNQLLILAKQEERLARLDGKVDFAITDSPLLLSTIYAGERYQTEWFREFVLRVAAWYHAFPFYIERVKPYLRVGRGQTLEEALEVDEAVRAVLWEHYPWAIYLEGDERAPLRIYQYLEKEGVL